ncbi:hypothetical protein CEXT_247951 [Caerostris extrusa]|uniref:RNase H type-1 domain-containing protein n=1 Tax=Caerostris extrusa TaxID=172846 RepID=A0AAV4UFV6_CAEEX|nr:hypothetical protein CEXT_247951 [Caerostris extrusa]
MFQNYRPIMLTSIADKAMEKIVVRRLNYYMETNGFIAKEQAGLRSSKSINQHLPSEPMICSFYVPVGRGTAFDAEVAAIRTALSQLQCHLEKFTRAVILCDSRAALLAIVSDNNPKIQDILDCRYHLENLASLEKL